MRLAPGTALTLNGIAQGIIADRVAALLVRRGFAAPRIDTGEMRLPGPDRRRLRLPAAGVEIEVADCAVATSAPDALRFPGSGHHLFDPRTGRCPELWRSVTVIAPTAADADALSTAFAVSTPERIGDLVPADTLVLATEPGGTDAPFRKRAGRRARMTHRQHRKQAKEGPIPCKPDCFSPRFSPPALAAPAPRPGRRRRPAKRSSTSARPATWSAPDAKNRVGPELNGVIGREIASAPDFKYSDAFLAKKAEGFTWTEENLADYLADPKDFIPGNKMAFVGLKKPEDIANVLAYLAADPGDRGRRQPTGAAPLPPGRAP